MRKREEASAAVGAWGTREARDSGGTDGVIGRMGDGGKEDCARQDTPLHSQASLASANDDRHAGTVQRPN